MLRLSSQMVAGCRTDNVAAACYFAAEPEPLNPAEDAHMYAQALNVKDEQTSGPEDAAKFAINLFQIGDYLVQSLHV